MREPGLVYALSKTAAMPGISDTLKKWRGALLISGMGAYAIKRVIDQIRNDQTRKALIEQLMTEDPILKDAGKEKLLEYYATLHMFAPNITKDKNAVREMLLNFVKFGKVDLATLEALSRTEANLAKQKQLPMSMKVDPLQLGTAALETFV